MPDSTGVRQANARRTRESVLAAAAAVFVEQGVQAPIRDIAGRAGVGLGTVYRHFPTRADLVTAVYRHQIDQCAALARELADEPISPAAALTRWIDAFVEFLVTKHGLGAALGSEDPSLENLHALMLDTLVPACAALIEAATAAGELVPGIAAYTLMRAVGNLCILGPGYERSDAKHMVARLLAGCRPSLPVPATAVAATSPRTGIHRQRPSASDPHGHSRSPERASASLTIREMLIASSSKAARSSAGWITTRRASSRSSQRAIAW
jgi:AcrR family transcriptional regulator